MTRHPVEFSTLKRKRCTSMARLTSYCPGPGASLAVAKLPGAAWVLHGFRMGVASRMLGESGACGGYMVETRVAHGCHYTQGHGPTILDASSFGNESAPRVFFSALIISALSCGQISGQHPCNKIFTWRFCSWFNGFYRESTHLRCGRWTCWRLGRNLEYSTSADHRLTSWVGGSRAECTKLPMVPKRFVSHIDMVADGFTVVWGTSFIQLLWFKPECEETPSWWERTARLDWKHIHRTCIIWGFFQISPTPTAVEFWWGSPHLFDSQPSWKTGPVKWLDWLRWFAVHEPSLTIQWPDKIIKHQPSTLNWISISNQSSTIIIKINHPWASLGPPH